MTIEEGIVAYLQTVSGVQTKVGSRIFPRGAAPDSCERPYILYSRVSGSREPSHGGSSKLAHSRLQLSCVHEEYGRAKELALAVVGAFDGVHCPMGDVARVASTVDNETDMFDQDARMFVVHVDVILWNSEG